MFGWRRLTEKHREDAELSLHCFASSRGLMRSAPMGRRSEHTCSRRSKRGKGGHHPCFCRLRPLGFCMECWAAPVATVVVSCSCSRWWNTGGPPVEQQLQDLLLGCPWPATSRSQHQIWPLGRHPHLLIYRQGSPEPFGTVKGKKIPVCPQTTNRGQEAPVGCPTNHNRHGLWLLSPKEVADESRAHLL